MDRVDRADRADLAAMSMRRASVAPPARPARAPPAAGGLRFDLSTLGDAIGRHTGGRGHDHLLTVIPSPYMEPLPHLEGENDDYDGGPWPYAQEHKRTPQYRRTPLRWVIAPQLGAKTPAICVFPRRRSTQIRFSPTVNLEFAAAYTPICARFEKVVLTDVDKLGNMPQFGQFQHWVATFHLKSAYGMNAATIRVRVNAQGDQLLGWAARLSDTDFAIEFSEYPPPPGSEVDFDSSTAVVVNTAFTNWNAEEIVTSLSAVDASVETSTRIARGRSAWALFAADAAMRSDATVESINNLRMTVYRRWFGREGDEQESFWRVNPNASPD